MGIFNLLANPAITVYGQTFDVSLNWIGNLIRLLITGVGSVGIGIILFSVILKVIVLPFDVYQRIAMRKQNQKMKDNQAKMEKLQKQYANNKEMYNQKVMEMYKESGFSMFSSCLPMILSLVIFIVAINAFNAYAQYSNIENYNTMVDAYNGQIEYYCADLTEENINVDNALITVRDADGENEYIYYTVPFVENYDKANIQAYIQSVQPTPIGEKRYYIDEEKALKNAEIKAYVDAAVAAGAESGKALENYFTDKAQNAVLTTYESQVYEHTSFLWIKNIWVTDASYKKPVLDYSAFKTEVSREDFKVAGEKTEFDEIGKYTRVYEDHAYNVITAKLDRQKNQANGYFILIALSIGTILLQQVVTMRSQKEQQKYSSVDGQGASQQKMTMIIMTGMFAIFSFMYSAAFSIYMIMSNVMSLASTLIINKAVDAVQNKKAAAEFERKVSDRHARTIKTSDNKKKKK